MPNPLAHVDDGLKGLPTLRIRTRCEILLAAQETVECEQGDREFLRHPLHVRLPTASPADLLERKELTRVRVDRNGLALDDRFAVDRQFSEALKDLRELACDVLQMTREELDLARRDVRLEDRKSTRLNSSHSQS